MDAQSKDGFTALYVAAQNGHMKVVSALLGSRTRAREPEDSIPYRG